MSYARFVRRFRFAIVAFWVAAVIAATLFLPNLTTVVASDGSSYLPATAESVQAAKLLDQIGQAHPYKTSALVAIVAPDKLTTADRAYLRRALATVSTRRAYYGVDYLQDAATVGKSDAAAFVSKDGTTEIGLVGFSSGETTTDTTDLARLKAVFATPPAGTKVYFTGSMPIGLDNINISMQGVARTVKVTVALVLIILILVLRSAVAPLIDLLTIGVSFLVTSGVVAWLAGIGLPVSTFTQTFLIAVLFGAGTDYSIILLNRFREELANTEGDVTQAIGQALAGVGKTLLFASLTVMVSFAVLFFAHFGLYRSGAPVAIGVAITLLACLTLIPALFAIMGEKLFWPRKIKPGAAHRTSRLWTSTARTAVRRPWWTIGLLAILLIPVALLNNGRVSFNTLDEIPQAPSVHGFKAVAKAFGEGTVLPVDVVLRTPANLRSPAGLATIEEITRALKSSAGVLRVDSATQPTGTVIRGFELADQNRLAASGLATIQSGVRTLGDRLDSAGRKLAQAQPGVQRLVSGARGLSTGAGTVAQAAAAADTGATELASGADRLAGGARSLQSGLARVASGAQSVRGGAQQLAGALTASAQGGTRLAQGTTQLASAQAREAAAARALVDAVANYARAHPNVAGSAAWQQIVELATRSEQGAAQTAGASANVAAAASRLESALDQMQVAGSRLAGGAASVAAGTGKLQAGSGTLAGGTAALASSESRLRGGLQQLALGSRRIAAASTRIASGTQATAIALDRAGSGYRASGAAAGQIARGVGQVESALARSAHAARTGDPGFYVSASEVRSNRSLQTAMNAYIAKDGHIAEFQVELRANPYSQTAISEVPALRGIARTALAAAPIASGNIYTGGVSATQADLNTIAGGDLIRTVALMLIAIFVLLAIMLRSLLSPLYLLASLIGSYLVTMGIVQMIAVHVLHFRGMDWTVPFFALLLLVALGVDYSIFLMTRFEEFSRRGLPPHEAVTRAMALMGNVIFSAALIMAGTFGSMTASGVTALMEIGMSVVIGLFLYTIVFLGLFVPAAVSVVDRAHHWPFVSRSAQTAADPVPTVDA